MPRVTLQSAAVFIATLTLPSLGTAQSVEPTKEGIQVTAAQGAPANALVAQLLGPEIIIRLDGRVDEDAWATAQPITDFTQQEPVEGGVPSEPTEIRVLFDEDALYIGVIIYDDPDGVLAFQRQRDAGLNTDDRFMWILDTFRDGRTGYFFEINAAGLMGDGILTSGGGGGRGGGGGGFGGGGANKAWDGIWEARTSMRPDGWSAEIRIPFRTLNFNPDSDTWGINFQRTIRRRNEEILWRGFRRNEGLRNPVYAGELTGLRGLSQGIGLEAIPSTVMGWREVPDEVDPTSFPRDLSLDINYSLTSSLRASLSLNTDFAEVESDQRRVNLTRFSQRFPEQRNFFLEGSSVFAFAPSSRVEPFYSRQVGLNQGRQIPLQYGGRVTGQIGKYELGVYQISTGSLEYADDDDAGGTVQAAIAREDFTVARIKRQILEQSSFGGIYTRRGTAANPLDAAGSPAEDAHTAGVDFNFSTRRFLGNNNLQLEAFYVWNSNTEPTEDRSVGDLSAHGFRLNFPNDKWSGHLSYRELGDDYRPALGFVTRNNFRRVEPRIQYQMRPSIDWIRTVRFSAQFRNLTQLGTGILEEREWQFTPFGVNLESGDGFDLNATRAFEFLEDGFTLSDVDILPGDYTNWRYRFGGRTSGRRRVSLFGGYNWGGFWDGTQTGYNTRMTFRPNPGISLSANFDRNRVSLPRGDFDANVYELEAEWNPDPWISTTTQVQYDNESGLVGLFARLRWIVTPGSDFFVYTHNWLNLGEGIFRDRDLQLLSRGATIKLNYTYRF